MTPLLLAIAKPLFAVAAAASLWGFSYRGERVEAQAFEVPHAPLAREKIQALEIEKLEIPDVEAPEIEVEKDPLPQIKRELPEPDDKEEAPER